MPGALGRRVRALRAANGLTQEALAAAALVSVQSVRNVEAPTYRLPTRSRDGGLVLELIAKALNEPLSALLAGCSDGEIADSVYSGLLTEVRGARVAQGPPATMRDFVASLPSGADAILGAPNLLSVCNAEAFAVIFALERIYTGYEALVVNEPPLIFLDDCDAQRWANGMRLQGDDRDVFLDLFKEYRSYFRERLDAGTKRYKVVLREQGLCAFLRGKSRARIDKQLNDISGALDNPAFQLVLHESHEPLTEHEVISVHQDVPSDLTDTLSIVIRQTTMANDAVEYCLIPMPRRFVALENDISAIETRWAEALDQYDRRRLEPLTDSSGRRVQRRTQNLIGHIKERLV